MEQPIFTFQVIKNDTSIDIEPPKQPSVDDILPQLHALMEKVYEYSKSWTVKNIDPSDLFLRNEQEYTTLMQFRKMQKLNSDMLTKKLLDNLMISENALFEARNENKAPTTTLPTEDKEKKKPKKIRFNFNKF